MPSAYEPGLIRKRKLLFLPRRVARAMFARGAPRAAFSPPQPGGRVVGMTSPGPTTQPAATPGDGAYARAYRRSLEDPRGFWGEAARGVDWITPPRQVLDDDTPPFYRWFPDGVLNTCYNALDRHVVAG